MSQIHVDALHSESGSNSNIELDNSRNTTCKGNLTVDGNIAVTGTGLTDTKSFRNLIINGAMNVAQRATSSTSGGYTVIDRWQLNDNNTNVTITQSQHALTSGDTGPWAKGFRNSYSIALSAAGNSLSAASYARLAYQVEAQDVASSGWDYTSASSKITLSFWFKCSTNQTFYGRFYTPDGTTQNYPFSFTATGNDTWTKITKTIPGNSNITVNNDNGSGLQLAISLFSGADRTDSGVALDTWAAYATGTRYPDQANTWITAGASTFEITGVQLEVGDSATDFEHKKYSDELKDCRRYYYQAGINDINTSTEWIKLLLTRSGGLRNANVMFRETMRAAPTVTLTGQFDDGGATIVAGGIGIERCTFNQSSSSAAGDAPSVYYWSAAAEL